MMGATTALASEEDQKLVTSARQEDQWLPDHRQLIVFDNAVSVATAAGARPREPQAGVFACNTG